MYQRQSFAGAEIAAVNIQRTHRAIMPTAVELVIVQVFDGIEAGLERMKHNLPCNAGDTQRNEHGDQKEHHISVHQKRPPRANVWVKSLMIPNTNRNRATATTIARNHGKNSDRFCGASAEIPKNASRS